MAPQEKIKNLLNEFGHRHGIPLTMENGVCALHDENGQEAIVLELPEGSDALLMHCHLFAMQAHDQQLPAWRLLLTLNFEMNAMRGCWLALDDEQQIRLCSQHAMSNLDNANFSHILLAFMQQAREARELILELFEKLE